MYFAEIPENQKTVDGFCSVFTSNKNYKEFITKVFTVSYYD